MPDISGLIIIFLAYLYFCFRRGMTYLHIFQQEEYDYSRFLGWIAANRVVDKRLTLILVVVSILSYFINPIVTLLLLFLSFAIIAVFEKDPRKVSKKKLVMTSRARRIFFISLGIMAVTAMWWFILPLPWVWILNVHLVPFALVIANGVLWPWENNVQKKYWAEAHKKLKDLNPKVIGITGSYGKTSVKHILGHILKTQAPTLITPGSVNTPMGITRIVREQLDESHKYFIAEMGAYGPGSVARLCRLAPPDIGVITAIGQAHYERFKSLETVAEAKFELAEAVAETGTAMIVHQSCLRFDYTREFAAQHKNKFIICGETGINDLGILSVLQRMDGLEVRVSWKGNSYTLHVPLYGIHHGHNVAMAFATAAALGIPPENIVTALRSVPQIQHRLEVKKQPGGSIIIDDAFNSNPEGFMSALNLLGTFPGRKILITPGMVELGAAHEEEHEKIGRRAGEICDIVLLVLPERVPSFIKGFKATGASKKLVEVGSFKDAMGWLDLSRQADDVVLIENDLPDLYESLPKL